MSPGCISFPLPGQISGAFADGDKPTISAPPTVQAGPRINHNDDSASKTLPRFIRQLMGKPYPSGQPLREESPPARRNTPRKLFGSTLRGSLTPPEVGFGGW